ncbi:hypothetical protein WA588_000588, partial [Blastocystis sp. NMH]
MQPLPQDPSYLLHLPVNVKSESTIPRVIGNAEKVFSNVKQGTDISISLFPDNPVMGTVNLHAKSSNKLILKTVKKGEDVSGSIVGVVKSEYTTNDLADFAYLPERAIYETVDEGILPHFDVFSSALDSESAFMVPIRFTPYNAPYDINMRDTSNEREKTNSKPYLFVSSDAPVPMEPRSDLPPMTPEHPQYKYLECVSQLFQLQPIWDKRYLTLEVQHRFPDDDPSVVQSAVATVTPYTGYVLTDGPFRNSWLRFGYDPSHDPSSWVYQYVEFRFSKRPQLKEKGDDGRPLPILYEVELNLHNRYPVWVLRKDKEMQQLIERIHPSATYNKREGWMSNGDVSQIRGLLKKQAELLLEKCGYDTDATLFSTVKRRIRNGSNKVEAKGRGEKTLSPTFAGSTENLMKEMPLTIAEAALGEMEEDGEDDGFEVYGDEDSV